MVVSDSAGLQEESTVFGKPCLTMRPNTERPVTVEVGSATIVDLDPDLVEQKTLEVLEGRYKTGQVPELWDGKTSERIVDLIDRLV
jgi:UDP-N-acetylglucosamine 2-epimerase (non-hydrolysing)